MEKADPKLRREVPAAQAIIYAIENALCAVKFLRELQSEFETASAHDPNKALIKRKQRVVADAFTIYLSSIFDRTKGTHSLIKSYLPHPFVEMFEKTELVQACQVHRNERSGHQSKFYGGIVPIELILSSPVESWLSEAEFAIASNRLAKKT